MYILHIMTILHIYCIYMIPKERRPGQESKAPGPRDEPQHRYQRQCHKANSVP